MCDAANAQIATAQNGTAFRRWFLNDVPEDYKTKEVFETEITMEVQWVPYDFDRS